MQRKTYYIVSGRIPYDDEDTIKIIEADEINQASEEFKRQMLEEGEPTEYDEDCQFEREDDSEWFCIEHDCVMVGKQEPNRCVKAAVVYVNYVIRCGEEKPEIEWMNY